MHRRKQVKPGQQCVISMLPEEASDSITKQATVSVFSAVEPSTPFSAGEAFFALVVVRSVELCFGLMHA